MVKISEASRCISYGLGIVNGTCRFAKHAGSRVFDESRCSKSLAAIS